MITAQSLSRTMAGGLAIRDVDLEVDAGDCVALVGDAGSGHTLLLRLLATLVRPSAGAVTIDGLDAVAEPGRVRARIGVASVRALSREVILTVRDHLRWLCAARLPAADARPAIDVALDRAGLPANVRVATLTPDQHARLALVLAILPRPRVLLVDGVLDLIAEGDRRTFIRWLRELRDAGTTQVHAAAAPVVLGTLCRREVRLVDGRIVAARGEA